MDNEAYRSGYGQARADAIKLITEALRVIEFDLKHYKPDIEQTRKLRDEQKALRWTRALITSLRSPQ